MILYMRDVKLTYHDTLHQWFPTFLGSRPILTFPTTPRPMEFVIVRLWGLTGLREEITLEKAGKGILIRVAAWCQSFTF